MTVSIPRVFNIPASAPFLKVLIEALIGGKLIAGFPASSDPLALAQATLYLPTRRACRLAREKFLDVIDGNAAILPRFVAIGDIDEDEIAFADAASGERATAALDLEPALGGLERRLLLAQIVAKWANTPELHGAGGTPLVANTPAAALSLADDLARLVDDMTTRQVNWDALDGLVPDELDPYWQRSLKLLKLMRIDWPGILAERNAIEPAARRDKLIGAEAARIANSDAPVIAAGSTGSMPATARLLETIARLPHGAVVLPGLDTDLDDDSWRLLADDGKAPAMGHAQFAMQALLERIGIARKAVTPLALPADHGREAFVSEALRPAATTEHWQGNIRSKAFQAAADRAVGSIAMIEAANAEEEALAIAAALREAVDEPGKTTALVTPDRALARRVLAALQRWNIEADDSGGDALADTPAGLFAQLVTDAALGGLEAVPLLALLKHALFRLDGAVNEHAPAVAAIERSVLRGPRPQPRVAGLAHALETFRAERDRLHARDPRKLVSVADLDAAIALVNSLGAALAPLEKIAHASSTLAALAGIHRAAIAALARDAGGRNVAFEGRDGQRLELALQELCESRATSALELASRDYPEIFRAAIAGRIVRLREKPGVRVRIFGQLEARLQNVDRMILGGLNEGVWPPETRSDPWLSRPMRRQLGLDLPERRIGLAAHDFAQGIGAREVILSRAAKLAGAPTVAARFVQRIAALAGERRWEDARARGERYLAWARALDEPIGTHVPLKRPEPKPPLAARPSRLSVTEIEDWLRDPYTIYARHVLRLSPLDAVDTPPGAADRGSVIHEAIGEFTKKFARALPDNPEKELIALGQASFAHLADYPEARAFWWPRFLRIAHWFAGWERARRPQLDNVHGEISGKLAIPLGAREFILSVRADRIERRKDGSYAIIDYKTGMPRTEKQVRTGLAPQLTLEAAILHGGGFENVPPGPVAEISYVTLKGGEPAGSPAPIEFKEGTPDSQAERALKRLTEVASRFEDETVPYLSLVHPMWTTHYGDYDHLARVKEWSANGGGGEE